MAEGTLDGMLRAGAARAPELPAILAPQRPGLDHGGLWRHAQGVAAWLNAAGIRRADRVAIVLPNGPEMAAAFLGVSAAAVSAPLNPAYRAEEFDFYLTDLQASALIVQDGGPSAAIGAAQRRGVPVIELSPLDHGEAGTFTLNGERPTGHAAPQPAAPQDVALVLHTSGTTSRPKRVPLTHANLCASAANVACGLSLSLDDRCLNVMPLFHIHGLVAATLATIHAGGAVICTPGFDSAAFFGWIEDLQPTWYTAVPTIHQEVLRRARGTQRTIPAHRLRFIRSCSAALPPQVWAELEALFGAPVIEAYGMTEAAHQIASNPLPPRKRLPGAVGLPTGCEVAIMDEHGALLRAGEIGEAVIRGTNVTNGYENDPAANASTFTAGWCRTGDQGMLTSEGYLILTGRLKELINRGGENIAPREIDEALLAHPDVREAVAFAVPHATLGETVAAAVVPHEGKAVTEAGLREFALQHLPEFKVPSRILVVPGIPKGPTGKLQRTSLGTQMAAQFATAYEAPAPGLEQVAADIFEQVLQPERIGRLDNFFSRGGDSIRAMQVCARLVEALGLEIPPVTLFHHPTPALLALHLDYLQQEQHIAALADELRQLPDDEAARMLRRAAGADS